MTHEPWFPFEIKFLLDKYPLKLEEGNIFPIADQKTPTKLSQGDSD